MDRRLMRPTAALFPLVGLIAALCAPRCRDFLFMLYPLYYAMQFVSLCAADSFRDGAAQEPGVRRVDRRFGGALLPLAVAILAALAAALLLRPKEVSEADHAAYLFQMALRAALAGSFICIEHLFDERMFALGRRIDGVILNCVSNGLLLAGALLDAGATGSVGTCFTVAAGLGALISVATSYAVEPIHGFSLAPVNLPFAPRACLQTLLYPAAALGLCALLTRIGSFEPEALALAALFGLIPWRLARTTCRRSPDESRPLNLLLVSIAALATLAAAVLPIAQPWALMAALALVCGAAAFCAPGWRLYTGIALMLAAQFAYPLPPLAIALSAASVLLNLKQAFLRKV